MFIGHILDELASKSKLSPDLWMWLNKRKNWLKDPDTEEQFDALLKHFTNHSLKKEQSLWESFKNLKTARNSFVHEGSAKVGDKFILSADAAIFVSQARAITKWVRELLPDDLKWPDFEPSTTFTIEQMIIPQQPNTPNPNDHAEAGEQAEE